MAVKKVYTKRKNIAVIILLAILLTSGMLFLLRSRVRMQTVSEEPQREYSEAATETAHETTKVYKYEVDIPQKDIDFDRLWEENTDVYAWIYIPNTEVDYPILQHSSDDEFYLMHNLDKSYGYPGMIYTEPSVNGKDFMDFNTVVYGHNMRDGSMFATLHYFGDTGFYEDNRYIFIYTPGDVFVYKIFAAYNYDNRHLLKGIDVRSEESCAAYIEQIYEQNGSISRDVEVTPQSRILTLSTCTYSDNKRWLVQAVKLNKTVQN